MPGTAAKPTALLRPRRAAAAAAGLLALILTPAAQGRDLNDIDFSLRLPAALSRFSPYSDVGGVGGASAASRYQSSINPAATDWQRTPATPVAISPQYTAIVFDRGPTVHVAAESATFETTGLGSFEPAAAQIRSVGATTGSFTLVDADYGQLQWGYKVGSAFAVGLNFNYSSFDTRTGVAGTAFGTAHSDTFDGRAGALMALSPQLMLGLVADFSQSPTTTRALSPLCGCVVRLDDVTTETLVRPGISYEYAELSSLYVDYQYGNYYNASGTLATNRLFFGIEHRVLPWLFARAGAAYDFRGILSPTAGVGIYPTSTLSIDIGFQNNMFPELRPEFGHSNTFGISLALLL